MSDLQFKTYPSYGGEYEPSSVCMIIQEDGRIIYAGSIFEKIVENSNIDNLSFSDIITISGADNYNSIKDIETGVHDLMLVNSNKHYKLRFDWVDMAGGRRYLLISDNENIGDNKTSKYKEIKTSIFQDNISLFNSPISTESSSSDIIDHCSYEELNSFYDMSYDIMIVCDLNGQINKSNAAFTMIAGNIKSNHNFISYIIKEDRSEAELYLNSLIKNDYTINGYIVDFEARMHSANNDYHWVEWRMKKSGNKIYITGRDLTQIKKQRMELEEREAQLKEAQSIGRIGHWYWKIGDETIDFSDEIYKIFGVSKYEFIPTLVSVNSLLHRSDAGRMMQAFQRAMMERRNYDMDFRIKQGDGTIRYVHCQGRCKCDDNGEVIALFGVIQDITERHEHEHELKMAKEYAEKAYAAKSQFLANMSHELRTPLNAIIGFSEMMENQMLGPIGNEKYLEYVSGIRNSGSHLLELINDILDMSKIEAGKYELDKEEIKLSSITESVINMIKGRTHNAGIEILTDIPDDTVHLQADRRALTQILLNLLSNAIKFTNSGGTVTIAGYKREDYIVIKVEDNGIGISAEKLPYITKPFEQEASYLNRDYEGSGLGLAITKELIGLHGGSMHIESTVGIGTIVSIRLPLDVKK